MRYIMASLQGNRNLLDHLASFLVANLLFVVVLVAEMVVYRPLGAIFDTYCSFISNICGKVDGQGRTVVCSNLLETLLFILLPIVFQLVTRLLGAYNFYILSYSSTCILRIMVA